MTAPRHRPRFVGAVLVFLVAVLGAGAEGVLLAPPATAATTSGTRGTAAAPASGAAVPAAASGHVELTLETVSPTVLTAGATLSVTAKIRNGTDDAIEGADIVLAANSRAVATRSELASWSKAGVGAAIGRRVTDQPVPTVAAGATANVTFTATAEDLNLGPGSDWGPRGLALVLTSDGSRLAVLRTFTLWAPTGTVTPVDLTIEAAVTGPAVDPSDATASRSAVAAQTSSKGRLGRLLDATAAHPEVGWVADPQLVEAARADSATKGWAERLLAAQAGRDVAALPSYDIDLAAYAHQGVPVPAEPPTAQGDPTANWRRDIAWPADATPDMATVALAASGGATSVIVRSGMDSSPDLTYTPSGAATLTTPSGPVTALIADDVLSTSLTGTSAGAAVDTQRLLAETAVIARELPAVPRHVLVVLDRSWEPDVAAFDRSMSALESAPWVQFATVDALRSAADPDVARQALPASSVSDDEISGQALGTLQAARGTAAQFAQVAKNPSAVTAPLDAGLVAPTAIAFRADPKARAAAVDAGVNAVTELVTHSIELVPRKTVRLLGESVNFPVLIRNTLDQPVTVEVVLLSDSTWIVQAEIPKVTIPANGESSLNVPVRAIASGSVIVRVHARAVAEPAGTGPDVAVPIDTRVMLRPELDTIGTWVVVVGVVLLLIGGIWRTIRRGRSPFRVAPDPASDTPPMQKRVP